jgi:hypothetical protein
MQRLLESASDDEPTTSARQRIAIVGVAVLATSATCLLALMLGSWAYRVRLLSMHEGRLQRLVAEKPARDLVTQAFENERSPLIAAPESAADVELAVTAWGTQRGAEIRLKASRAAKTLVFRAGQVVYFLYFDTSGTLVDFTCVLQ